MGSQRAGHWEGKEDRRLEGLRKGRLVAAQAKAKAAVEAFTDLLPLIRQLRSAEETLQAIAHRLNTDGYTTRNGRQFTPTTVHRIIARSGAASFVVENQPDLAVRHDGPLGRKLASALHGNLPRGRR